MHAVISLLLQSRKFWWYLLLTSSMLLHDIIMTSYCCQRYAECLVTTLFQQASAPAHCTAHVQRLNCCVKKRQPLCVQAVTSKQPRSHSSGLRDLGCHAASGLPQTNPQCGCIETATLQYLVRSWTVDFWRDCWPVAKKTSSHAKGGHFEYSLWTDNVDFVHICYIPCDLFDCRIFNYEIMPATLANTFLFILQGSAVADFMVHVVIVNFCLQHWKNY